MSLVIGVCRVRLRLPENHSLKGKRQVLKSLIARLRNKFNVSAAEVSDHDSWQLASIAVASVSNDERHANQVLAAIISFIESERLDAEIIDYETEIIRGAL
ncbi:MAG TPA: DUF503 domain-containing protein [Dehalococcoidia bacterium]|nr:DUF503 domain-containing protein [Dehalococcoidia bacterium]